MSRKVLAARSRVLQTAFRLLYTRLGYLHEPVGRIVYGAAWDGRRRIVLPTVRRGALVDLGCGDGRFLQFVATSHEVTVGIEPSREMVRRARHRRAMVVCATAQHLPWVEGAFAHVVATYPGPWIFEPKTWDEVERVTSPGATISVLLGGDYRRGRGSTVRRLLLRLAYGSGPVLEQLPTLGNPVIPGEYKWIADEWGTALVWRGTRHPSPVHVETT